MKNIFGVIVSIIVASQFAAHSVPAADARAPLVNELRAKAARDLEKIAAVDALLKADIAEFAAAVSAAESAAKQRGIPSPSMCAYPVASVIVYALRRSKLPPEQMRLQLRRATELWSPLRAEITSALRTMSAMQDREALHRMHDLDQATRARMSEASALVNSDPSIDRDIFFAVRSTHMCVVDMLGTELLRAYLERHGWPAISIAGKDADAAAWILLVHGIHDLDFQAAVLERVEPYVKAGDSDALGYARMRDRLLNMHGRPQLFGTQYECINGKEVLAAFDDEPAVRTRRAELRLGPLQLERGPC